MDQVWTYADAPSPKTRTNAAARARGPEPTAPDGNPNWGGPLTFQDPRTLRLGIRLSW